jgi:hypothetical protein
LGTAKREALTRQEGKTMTEQHEIPPEAFKLMADFFDRGIDEALVSEKPEYVTGAEMGEAHYRTGVICGQAIKIAELLGEGNAAYSLGVATRFLKGHFENLRAGLVRTDDEKGMADDPGQPDRPSVVSVYDRGFEFGRSDALQAEIRKPRETDSAGDDDETLHAVHCAAALAGLATKIADMMGEDKANHALQQAANAVAVHCFKKRNAN